MIYGFIMVDVCPAGRYGRYSIVHAQPLKQLISYCPLLIVTVANFKYHTISYKTLLPIHGPSSRITVTVVVIKIPFSPSPSPRVVSADADR